MNDDELRDRLGALDPAAGGADPEPATSPSARALLEEIMSTPVVDEAYRGVDAGAVTLVAPEGLEALIGGVAWQVGRPYLVSASDGVVHYCGQTGPATTELQAIYDAAFAG